MPLSENEMKQIKDLIDSVEVNKSNLEHIAKTGNINGGLLVELRRILTAQAEKYQNEIKQWKQQLIFAEEIEKQMQVRIEQDIAELASRDSELKELREVADLVVKALDYWDRTFQNDDYSLFQSMPTKDSFWRPDDEIKRTSEALAAYRKIKPEIKP